MNNEQLKIEEAINETPKLEEKEFELVELIEAIKAIAESKEWQILKDRIFDGVVNSLERRLTAEVSKKELDQAEIHRLNGQLTWARKYADFDKLADAYRLELSNIRKKING